MSGMVADFKTLSKAPDAEQVVPILARLLHRAWQALDSDADAARLEIRKALEVLSGAAVSIEVQPGLHICPRHALAPWQARRVLEYIHANLEISIPVEDMASLIGLSTSYFFRAFKRSFGVSPHGYITVLRLARARELLVGSEEQISEIAVACGFADQAHFSRIFRREAGCPPGVWRRRQRRLLIISEAVAPGIGQVTTLS